MISLSEAELKALKDMIWQGQKEKKKNLALKSKFPGVKFAGSAFADDECAFDEPVVLGANVKLYHCEVGRYTYIAENAHLHNCKIGAFCSIGPELLAGLGMHPASVFVSTHPSFYSPDNSSSPVSFVDRQKFTEHEPVEIGNDVWIGARVVLMDGVKIGDGAMIAAGAVVVKDVEPYSIVGGVPTKEIRKRFDPEQIDFLLKFRWWEKEDAWLEHNADLFSDIKEFAGRFGSENQ